MPEGTPRPRVAAAVFEVVLDGRSFCPQGSACDDPPNPSQVRIIVTTPLALLEIDGLHLSP